MFLVILGNLAILGPFYDYFFRKSDQNWKTVLKFAKMDPSQKIFIFENLFYFGPLVKIWSCFDGFYSF